MRCTPVSQHLIGLGYTVTLGENGQKALDMIQQQNFEMVLLDLPLQDRSAEEFIKGMKANNALRGIPLIILAESDQLEEAERCIKSGAEDYIVLPFRPVVLKARISANLERQRVRFAAQTPKDMHEIRTGCANRAARSSSIFYRKRFPSLRVGKLPPILNRRAK